MAFKIVRNDITKVEADIIVNTANPKPKCVSGTDLAIYEAAGKEALLAERETIGPIERGEIAVTGAYNLNAKYIIHTVGPVWIDGNHHELEILERCYRLPLQKAIELGCQSIAFPLISTGVYEFPKDKALHIAVSVFSQFLTEHEIEIILVVFDKTSFQLSSQIVGKIDSYIDANYVKESHINEYPLSYRRSARLRSLFNSTFHEESSLHLSDTSLENQLANLDRKLFSKIQCNKNYHPKKKTVFALCIALHLNLEESKDLLARADWAFSPSSKVDLIVQKAIIDKQYDIMELNITLFKYTNETLGA